MARALLDATMHHGYLGAGAWSVSSFSELARSRMRARSSSGMTDPIAPPSTSLVAGKYQLNGMIGRGGMGSVWEGRHKSLGTRVAVKFIEKEYADSPEARARFDNEARAAATIQSKYAVQIFDHGVTDDGRPFIVMELLEGEGLDRRIERMGRMPVPEVARIFLQVSRALQRAHDGGIIHRDLKPENIFLQRLQDDDEEIAKVLDFGIAKIRSVDGTTLSSSTKTGAVLGTPFYMSPEQARGLRDIDHRTDLWSLGVIAFKCVTGVLPFDGQSLGDLLVKICTAPMPVPSQVVPGLPPAFDAWFARALDREPANRYATATELAEALAFAAGLSVRRGSANSGSNPHVSQTPAAVMAPVSMGQTPSTGGLPPTFGATSAPFTATSPGTGKRSSTGLLIGVALAMLVAGAGGGVLYKTFGGTQATVVTAQAGAAVVPPSSASLPSAPPSAGASIANLDPKEVVPAGSGAPAASVGTLVSPPANAGRGGKRNGKNAPPPLPKPIEAKTSTNTTAPVEPRVETKPKTEPTKVANPGF